MRWIAVSMFSVGLALLAIAAWLTVSAMRWHRESALARGTIVAHQSFGTNSVRPVVRFQLPSGETITAPTRTTAKRYLVSPVGEVVTLRYRIADPSWVDGENEMWWWWPAILTTVALMWTWVVAKNLRRL